MSPTKALQEIGCISAGRTCMVQRSSVRPINAVKCAGRKPGVAGWLGCVRLLRPSMASCSIPFGWLVSVLMLWMAFKHVWRRKWPCITFASGSTCTWDESPWLSLTCSTGKFVISIHTKRLTNANLSGADLTETDLSSAHFDDAILIDADLNKANLSSAYFI